MTGSVVVVVVVGGSVVVVVVGGSVVVVVVGGSVVVVVVGGSVVVVVVGALVVVVTTGRVVGVVGGRDGVVVAVVARIGPASNSVAGRVMGGRAAVAAFFAGLGAGFGLRKVVVVVDPSAVAPVVVVTGAWVVVVVEVVMGALPDRNGLLATWMGTKVLGSGTR